MHLNILRIEVFMEENKNLVSYCGLYCGDCFNYRGEIADLARDLRKVLRKYKFAEVAKVIPFKEFKNYEVCYETLGAMVKLRCKRACRGGGGPPFCKIRDCCREKGIEGCWECDEFEICKKLNFLTAVHGDAHLKNLRKIKRVGLEDWLSGKRLW